MPARMPRLGAGFIVPAAAVVLAIALSLLASHQDGVSGQLYVEILIWGVILGGGGVAIVALGARFLDGETFTAHRDSREEGTTLTDRTGPP